MNTRCGVGPVVWLPANAKQRQGAQHLDRDAPFQYLNAQVAAHLQWPLISQCRPERTKSAGTSRIPEGRSTPDRPRCGRLQRMTLGPDPFSDDPPAFSGVLRGPVRGDSSSHSGLESDTIFGRLRPTVVKL